MLHPSIRLEGSILSADILDAIERGERAHQLPKDFGLDPSTKVKDEIADAWAAARAYWAAYQVKISRLKEGATGTTETRNQWLVPLLGLLGYQLNLTESETLQGKTYRISHRDPARDQLPVHLIGWHESLDRRSTVPNAPRMSPHGLVQEYLNLTEHLYGIASNGRLIRLLRDSSRLVKLTFIEFDLERIFTEELFADFALFYRLLHASRLPVSQDNVAEAPIEIYHQDSLDSGSRIRDGLSTAVHSVILALGNGLLNHPANNSLRELAATDPHGRFSADFYAHLLRLIYRLLFLMVIEERGLAHVQGTDKRLREIYDFGYSLARLRKLSEKPHFADARHSDAWLALIALFRLVDESGRGLKLGVAPLGGDLFNRGSLGVLEDCSLDNATFLGALRQLTLFTNPVTRQLMRVTDSEQHVLRMLSWYVRERMVFKATGRAGALIRALAMHTYQKIAASSWKALEDSLVSRLAGRTAEPEGMDEEALLEYDMIGGANEIQALNELLGLVRNLKADTKSAEFVKLFDPMAGFRSEGEKVLVFTQYRSTQQYLRSLLEALGLKVALINGTLSIDQRREQRAYFEDSADVMISTEAGSEGANLHRKCHLLINYDSPWNPMRLLQRVGRLDRYGQKQKVTAITLRTPQTWDSEISRKIDAKLAIIQARMGQVADEDYRDMIVGAVYDGIDVGSIMAAADWDLNASSVDHAIDDEIAKAREDRNRLKQVLSDSVGMPDGFESRRADLGSKEFHQAFKWAAENREIMLRETRTRENQYLPGVYHFTLPESFRMLLRAGGMFAWLDPTGLCR